MKRLVFLSVSILLCATFCFAQAQNGTVKVYADQLGTECNFTDEVPGTVSYYLFYEGSPGASAVEFQLDLAGFSYTSFLGDNSPYPLKIGNFYEGASLSFGTCLFGNIYLGVAHFVGAGTTSQCHYIFVKNHPQPSIPGATTPIAVDCWTQEQLLQVEGSAGIINPNEDCQCPDIFENCPETGTGTLLFAARLSTDAGAIPDPPGEPYVFATRLAAVTRRPNEKIYLSGSPDSWTPLVVDEDIFINNNPVGPGSYTVLDPSYPLDTPVEQIFQPELADEIPVSLIPYGTSCVVFGLADMQREIYGNTDIYLFIAQAEPTTLTIECPDTITVACVEEIPPPDINTVTVSSDCLGDITVMHAGDVSNYQSCPEIITRTYEATDNCYNRERCSQTIVVIDPGTPVISGGPADVSVQCVADIPAPNISLIHTAGGCAGGITVTHEGDTPLSGPCGGYIDRTYRATNLCGNFTEYVQRITVDDTTPPVFSYCPEDEVIECVEDVPPAEPEVSDNCGGAVTSVVDLVQEAPDRLRRTWTATDQCGNSAVCTQVLTIHDTSPPTMYGCPSSMFLECGSEIPPPANVTFADNCDQPLASVTFEETETNPGADCDNIITRTWTAVDSSGNTRVCSHFISLLAPPVCSVSPDVLDFGLVAPGQWKDMSFYIHNVSDSMLTGSVFELCEHFSIQTGGGAYSLAPSEYLEVVVRFSPNEQDFSTCTIYTGSDCADVFVSGISIVSVDVTVQSYAVSWQEDHVELSWQLKEISGDLSFDINRRSRNGDVVLLENPDISMRGDRFVCLDRSAEPGETYTYRVSVKENGVAAASFETTIAIPALAFSLDQAHPNPFKNETQIGFSLAHPDNVSLAVYDISGGQVCTLEECFLDEGKHTAVWDGRDNHGRRVASGIYFYRLKAGKQVLIRKMVLLR